MKVLAENAHAQVFIAQLGEDTVLRESDRQKWKRKKYAIAP